MKKKEKWEQDSYNMKHLSLQTIEDALWIIVFTSKTKDKHKDMHFLIDQ